MTTSRIRMFIAGCALVLSAIQPVQAWTATGAMTIARDDHTATLLPNGKVLVAGGVTNGTAVTNTAELYDPSTGTWTSTGSMSIRRCMHTATLLPNGKVLVVGGLSGYISNPLASAELYDPATGTWTTTGSMPIAHGYHVAVLMSNGKVLIAGGATTGIVITATAVIYDPATGAWTSTGKLTSPRAGFSGTLLPNGKVLVAGGQAVIDTMIGTAELYNPTTGTWSSTGSMSTPRSEFSLTVLSSGKVLAAGGWDNNTNPISSELYDSTSGTWALSGSLGSPRAQHAATLLPSGNVLLTGGDSDGNTAISSVNLYNAASGIWTDLPSLNQVRSFHTATLLPNGNLLVAGGQQDSVAVCLSSCELIASVSTGGATAIGATSATLNGAVNPSGFATTARFEYGLTTAYGSTANVTLTPNNGTSKQNVSAAISGLQGGRTYHYRLTATNAVGTITGADMTFTTSSPLPKGALGNPYSSTTIQANGGTPPHTWSLVIGSLPTGLVLDPATGTIHGTPTTAGTSNFRVRITGSDGAYTEGTYGITVLPDPFIGSYSPPMKSHDNIRNFGGTLDVFTDYSLGVTQNDPSHYTAKFTINGGGSQTIANLLRTGNRIQNTMRPQPLSDANLLDFIMLTDGVNRTYVHVAQETYDPDDISVGVASWTSHVGNVTAVDWAGNWVFDTYGDPNLRNTADGFDHETFTLEIQQVDADHIRIMLPSGGALPLRVSGNTAFLETQPLVVGTIRYHDFRLQGDGQRMSLQSVASEINDLTDVAVTIGLAEKTSWVPSSIVGNVLTYNYSGGWFRESFNSNGSGVNETSDGKVENFTYTYSASGNTAVTDTTVAATAESEHTIMNYTSATGGVFTYRFYTRGVLDMDLAGTFTVSGNQIALNFTTQALAEIAVEHPTGNILMDGSGSVAFGDSNVGAATPAKTFTIRNTGTADLNGIVINKTGEDPGAFLVNGPATGTLAPGASTTFTVIFNPTAAGTRNATLQITSNDADENPFDVQLTGTGLAVDPFTFTIVGTPFVPQVGHQLTLDLKRLANPGETIKLVGKLPTGLRFNATTGLLSGVISGKAGSYPLTVQFLQGKTLLRTVSLPLTIQPYPATLLGSFEGLLEDDEGLPTGVIRLSITKPNAWSATLESAGTSRRSAKGSFLLDEQNNTVTITANFPVSGTVPAENITMTLNADSPLFGGTRVGGTLRGFRMAQGAEIISSTSVCNIALDAGEQDGIAAPAGIGWLSGKFGKTGSGSFKGLLGDATAASVSLRISATGQALVWAQPYSNKQSYIAGIIDLPATWNPSSDDEQLESGLWWFKAADAKTLAYPSGFGPLLVEALGAAWTPPASALALGNALGWQNGRTVNLEIEGAGLNNEEPQVTAQALPTALTLDDKFNLNAAAPQGVLLVPWLGKVAKADGKWTGTLTLPGGFAPEVLAGKASASGVLLPGADVSGCGLIKVPVASPKGSFRTAATILAVE